LTDKEIQLLLDFCMEEKQKPQTKKLYFEFLYTTALRKNIAQTITIDDIKRKLDIKHQKEYWVIEVMDKEHQRNIGILDEFYNRLINNAENQKYNDNKLFHLDNHTADKVLKNFCKKYGINRNIVQHSVKSSSGDLVQNVFQDIKKTAKHLGHTNIQTSYEYYLGKNESYAEQPSVLLQENYNINMLKGLGEDVLIKIIEQYTEKHGRDLLIKMCMELNELTK
jgi:integrase